MKKNVFENNEDFTQSELEEIMFMIKSLEEMTEKERKLILKAVEIHKGTKYGY
jgi:hypothetical protein